MNLRMQWLVQSGLVPCVVGCGVTTSPDEHRPGQGALARYLIPALG